MKVFFYFVHFENKLKVQKTKKNQLRSKNYFKKTKKHQTANFIEKNFKKNIVYILFFQSLKVIS